MNNNFLAKKKTIMITIIIMLFTFFSAQPSLTGADKTITNITNEVVKETIDELLKKHGESHRFRIEKGVARCASSWREDDGSTDDFKDFCLNYFIADKDTLHKTLARVEKNFETLWGYFRKIKVEIDQPLELDFGPPLAIDHLFGDYSPSAHLDESLFKDKVAFAVILNFPYYSLQEKIEQGDKWSRLQWAMAKAGEIFTSRLPAALSGKTTTATTRALYYASQYKIHMGYLLNKKSQPLFPKDLVLTTHWGIRDEIRARYNDPQGKEKQEIIFKVMERIIDQSIPKEVINKPVLWNPFTNQTFDKKGGKLIKTSANPEAGIRYNYILDRFHIERSIDPCTPGAPTKIKRYLDRDRQMTFEEVEQLLISVLESPQAAKVADLIGKRLQRPLIPYDVWYNGFASRGKVLQYELDKVTQKKYPDAMAVQKDIPNILHRLGFSPEQVKLLSELSAVDPSRGVGHGSPTLLRGHKSRVRTRFTPQGLRAINFFTILHEFGHIVENIFSLNKVDHYLLSGVPNGAFSECFAYIFGDKDMELLGLEKENPEIKNSNILNQFWLAYETSGVALVDMRLWQWLYRNPQANVIEIQEAVIRIAKEVWNTYFAPVLKVKDTPVLAIYNHLLFEPLYFCSYPMAYFVRYQIEEHMAGKNLGAEIERMCATGSLTPRHWMQKAVGAPLSTRPLLDAVDEALKIIKK